MTINNISQIRKKAELDLSKKLRLEPFLASDMRRMFKNLLSDFRSTYSGTHTTISPEKYIPDTTAILRHHYRKVSKAFIGDLQYEISKNQKAVRNTDPVRRTRAKLSGFIMEHSEKQARIIINTTSKELDKEIESIIAKAIKKGKIPSSQQIADAVFANYSKKVNGRAKTISITETQMMAEKTKDEEAKEVSKEIQSETGSKRKLRKMWVAILDEVTREWHADADGQEVPFTEPFIVNGEELYYPGDESGSPENIINCRCSSVRIV